MVERESGASRLFNILNYVFLAFIGIICLYPFLYVVFASSSEKPAGAQSTVKSCLMN